MDRFGFERLITTLLNAPPDKYLFKLNDKDKSISLNGPLNFLKKILYIVSSWDKWVVNLVLYLFYFLKILLLFIHYVSPNRNLDYYFVILVILQKFGLLDF